MGTLNDEILRATGGPTVNDGLASWYGQTASETLMDAERRWLFEQHPAAPPESTIGDLWMRFVLPVGGTINDKQLAYWTAQP